MDEKYYLEFLEKLKDKPLREIYIPPEKRIITANFHDIVRKKKEKTYCVWINKKGKRVGEECGKITFADKLCSSHYSLDIKNRKKNGEVVIEKNKSYDSLDKYEDETSRCPNPDRLCDWIKYTADGEIKCGKITSEDRKWCNTHRIVYLLNKRSKSMKNKEES